MGSKTNIEWTETTWNPIRGCSRISEGCRFCYAERVASRFSGKGEPYEGLAGFKDGEPRWTGKVRVIEEHLRDPLRWKRPRKIFVNSMSDLFHEKLPFSDVAEIFDIMADARAEHHTFQVLTKRPDRMREFFRDWCGEFLAGDRPLGVNLEVSEHPGDNIWLGTSVEDQQAANRRIPELFATPAAVRWISAEPLLGPIDLRFLLSGMPRIDWVVVGGESGPGARPMRREWVERIVADCRAAGVAVFVKQLGAAYIDDESGVVGSAVNVDTEAASLYPKRLSDAKGKKMDEWPESLRVREYPAPKLDVSAGVLP